MSYIGRPLQVANLAVQSGAGDGSDTTPIATLDYATTTNGIAVYLDGVRQLAGTDFNVTAQTTLTFTTAPANGVGVDVYFLGLELSLPTPADASVIAAKIAANAVDETKLKDALIGDFTDATVTAADYFLHGDATDSGNTKKDTVQGILDLVPSSHTVNSAVVSTSGTSIELTSIASTVKRITIQLRRISTNGTSDIYVVLGDSGGYETSGYTGGVFDEANAYTAFSAGFNIHPGSVDGTTTAGTIVLRLQDASDYTWTCDFSGVRESTSDRFDGNGYKTLSGALTTVKLTTAGGSAVFDFGEVTFSYES